MPPGMMALWPFLPFPLGPPWGPLPPEDLEMGPMASYNVAGCLQASTSFK